MDRPGWLICSNTNCRAEKGFREDIKTGDIICTLCGRVAHEKMIDLGSEWRNFGGDGGGENKSRAESVDDINDKLSTNIQISKQADRTNAAMSKLHQQISGNEQKSLTQASTKIAEFGAQMNLPNTVMKSAKKIYKDFETKKKGKIRGSNSDPFIVAVIYIACKENSLSRTFKDLARETDIKEIEIRRMYKALTKHLGNGCGSRSIPVAPQDLVIRICSMLNLKEKVIYLAQQIAKNAASRLEGKSPSSIAAASILMAVKHEGVSECTEREIASAASISSSTVKNIYKEMESMKDEIMSKEQTAI
jgi:transcription initiation factor TFIIB